MKRLNIFGFLLLALIAIGVWAGPHFNYAILVERQNRVEGLLNTVLERLEKIETLLGTKQGSRMTALSALDQLPGALGEVKALVGSLSEEQALLRGEVDVLRARLDRDGTSLAEASAENERADSKKTKEESGPLPPFARGNYTDPIDLPEDLAKRAKRFSPRATSDMKLEDFIAASIEAGIVDLEDPTQILPEAMDRLGRVFEVFKANVDLIQVEQNLFVQGLVEKRTAAGDFIDLPQDAGPAREEFMSDGVGIRFVRFFDETATKRVFNFPLEDYPEIDSFNELRYNARDHLVRDVAGIPRALLRGK